MRVTGTAGNSGLFGMVANPGASRIEVAPDAKVRIVLDDTHIYVPTTDQFSIWDSAFKVGDGAEVRMPLADRSANKLISGILSRCLINRATVKMGH